MIVERKLKIIQGDPMETQWLLDNHIKVPVRPDIRQKSAIYQKRNYSGMKKLESFLIICLAKRSTE